MNEKGPLKIFYCYAKEDRQLRDKLDIHFANLKHQNIVQTWYDREILPGLNGSSAALVNPLA